MKTRPIDIWRFLGSTRTFSPSFNPSVRYVLERKWDLLGRVDTLFCPTKVLDSHRLFITERVLELPFAHRALDQQPGSRILEFGCTNSTLSIEFASRGMLVTGVDLRPYTLTHPNLTFYQGDFFDQNFLEAPFDAIIAISALEHVGLGAYGEARRDDKADRLLVEEFFRLLKPEGQLILTIPFGAARATPRYRIYDMYGVLELLNGFSIDREEYYRRNDYTTWMPTTGPELSEVEWQPSGAGAEGVALVAARRAKDDS